MARHASTGDVRLERALSEKLRAATERLHQEVELSLDLLSPDLTLGRLRHVVSRLSVFWCEAEGGVDAWAAGSEDLADEFGWALRRRSHLFARQALALGAGVQEVGWAGGARPALRSPGSAGEVLGRLYVLEGSTLGGRFILRHLAGVPLAASHDWTCFNPYGPRTAQMWNDLRAHMRRWVGRGGDPDVVVAEAVETFEALRVWCATLRPPSSPRDEQVTGSTDSDDVDAHDDRVVSLRVAGVEGPQLADEGAHRLGGS